MTARDDEEVVKTVSSDGAHPALGERVGVRHSPKGSYERPGPSAPTGCSSAVSTISAEFSWSSLSTTTTGRLHRGIDLEVPVAYLTPRSFEA